MYVCKYCYNAFSGLTRDGRKPLGYKEEASRHTITESTGVCDASADFKKRFTTSSPIGGMHILTKEEVQEAVDNFMREKYPKHEPFTLSLTIKDNPQPVTESSEPPIGRHNPDRSVKEYTLIDPHYGQYGVYPCQYKLSTGALLELIEILEKEKIRRAQPNGEQCSKPPQETPIDSIQIDEMQGRINLLHSKIDTVTLAFANFVARIENKPSLDLAEIAVFRKMVKNLKAE